MVEDVASIAGEAFVAKNYLTVFAPERDYAVRVRKYVDRTMASVGETVTYTIVYENMGKKPLSAVTVSDRYNPKQLWVENGRWSRIGDGQVVWQTYDMMPGEIRKITYQARIQRNTPRGTQIENAVQVRAAK